MLGFIIGTVSLIGLIAVLKMGRKGAWAGGCGHGKYAKEDASATVGGEL